MSDGKKKTKTAFHAGTLCFRHGAKSEPANSHDLKHVIERKLAAERKTLLSNVGKVWSGGLGSGRARCFGYHLLLVLRLRFIIPGGPDGQSPEVRHHGPVVLPLRADGGAH